MRAAITPAVGQPFLVTDVTLANPIGREILIEVKASGLCHSDIGVAEVDRGFPMPALLGHEISGIVAGVGPDVRDFQIGDVVAASPISSCGSCNSCLQGHRYRCRQPEAIRRTPEQGPRITLDGQPVAQFIGIGGFAERALVHENNVVKLPTGIPFDVAALLGCGVVTGAGAAINSARVRPGDTVAVIGCGGVGLNVIQGARLAGARRIIAIDLQPAKLQLAAEFGATDIINAGDTDAVAAVRELTQGGVTHAFEVIGLKQTAEQAVAMLEKGGTAYLIGVQRPGTTLELLLFEDITANQKGVRAVAMGSSNLKVDIPMYAELYLQGRFKLDELISQRISLDEINEGYVALKNGGVARSVITSF